MNSELVLVTVDTESCIGGGQCEMLEPGVFVLDDDAMSSVIGDRKLPPERAATVIDRCPGRAISIVATSNCSTMEQSNNADGP